MTTDWNNLIREIERGNCAIIMGHQLVTDADGVPHYSRLCRQLAADNADLIHAFYPQEHFFLFKATHHRRKFANAIEKFYNELQPDAELYRLLAEIPVKLYVSVSPDNFLDKTFGEENATCAFFNYAKPGLEPDYQASIKRPLVYHIFGSVENPDSLVLSHDNLYHYLQAMMNTKNLPQDLRRFFKDDAGGEVIFLGFDFRKWYVQLLLRLFNLSKTDNELNRTAYDANPDEDDMAFAVGHFHVQFIKEEVKTFVRTLHQKCREKGILRQLGSSREEAQKVLAEERQQRLNDLKTQLQQKNRLRTEWGEKELLADNPTERMRCEKEIARLNEQIDKLWIEIKELAQLA
jgi:hypothetical protein